MSKRFIPAEEVSHLNAAWLVLVDHSKGCQTPVHAKMDVYHVYFSSKRGAPAQLVRGLRAGHEDVSAPDLSRYPVADDVTFLNPNTITLGQLQQLRQFFRRSPSFLSSKKSDDACAMRSVSSSQIGVLL